MSDNLSFPVLLLVGIAVIAITAHIIATVIG